MSFDPHRRDRLLGEYRRALELLRDAHEDVAGLERARDAAEQRLAAYELPLIQRFVELREAFAAAEDPDAALALDAEADELWRLLITPALWARMEWRLSHAAHRAGGRTSRSFNHVLLERGVTAGQRSEYAELIVRHELAYWDRVRRQLLPSLARGTSAVASLWHGLHTTACFMQLDFAAEVARQPWLRLGPPLDEQMADSRAESGLSAASDDTLDVVERAIDGLAYTDPLGAAIVRLTLVRELAGDPPVAYEEIVAAFAGAGNGFGGVTADVAAIVAAAVRRDRSLVRAHTPGALRVRKNRFLSRLRASLD
jgi:hypothetical protein